MSELKPSIVSRLKGGFPTSSAYRKAMVDFAKHHGLIYFNSVIAAESDATPVVRGSTAASHQKDNHICIGTHAGYDMTLVDRTSVISYEGQKTTLHRWYVIQIDLRSAKNLPYIFVGTSQQTKAYYARVLSAHRELRYLSLSSKAKRDAAFHSHYAVMASPSQTSTLYRLFTDENIDSIAVHNYPFAIELEDESLSIITEAIKPNQQLLDKLLHYGLWLAKQADVRLV